MESTMSLINFIMESAMKFDKFIMESTMKFDKFIMESTMKFIWLNTARQPLSTYNQKEVSSAFY